MNIIITAAVDFSLVENICVRTYVMPSSSSLLNMEFLER